ncbi:MAG TPA: hypothetical protein PLO41_22600, partial [Rubrivivax sp.]|nr:hypothetical protein [Rubrivivax sp.]
MNIVMLGAGAWGTALALAAAQRHDTLLWTRDAAQAAQMNAQRRNERYLPELALPPNLRISADHDAAPSPRADGIALTSRTRAGSVTWPSMSMPSARRSSSDSDGIPR